MQSSANPGVHSQIETFGKAAAWAVRLVWARTRHGQQSGVVPRGPIRHVRRAGNETSGSRFAHTSARIWRARRMSGYDSGRNIEGIQDRTNLNLQQRLGARYSGGPVHATAEVRRTLQQSSLRLGPAAGWRISGGTSPSELRVCSDPARSCRAESMPRFGPWREQECSRSGKARTSRRSRGFELCRQQFGSAVPKCANHPALSVFVRPCVCAAATRVQLSTRSDRRVRYL